jgi:hypothetical protein
MHGNFRRLEVLDQACGPTGPKEMGMKTFRTRIPFLAVMFACVMVATATAECGHLTVPKLGPTLKRQAWKIPDSSLASLQLISDGQEPVVGLWNWKMVSEGSDGIPDGTVVDQGFSQWHSDGTELTVSGNRAPATGDVCLGAWKKEWSRYYKLSHYGISYDTNNNYVGLAHITQKIVVSSDGMSSTGRFTIDQYDASGNLLVHIQGNIGGTKVTADSPTIVAF